MGEGVCCGGERTLEILSAQLCIIAFFLKRHLCTLLLLDKVYSFTMVGISCSILAGWNLTMYPECFLLGVPSPPPRDRFMAIHTKLEAGKFEVWTMARQSVFFHPTYRMRPECPSSFAYWLLAFASCEPHRRKQQQEVGNRSKKFYKLFRDVYFYICAIVVTQFAVLRGQRW